MEFDQEYSWEEREAQTKEFKKWYKRPLTTTDQIDGLPIEVARQLGKVVPCEKTENIPTEKIVKELFQTKKAGHIIGKLIAERRFGKHIPGHDQKIAKLAQVLAPYEKTQLLPDPLNSTKRFNVTRLIASIDYQK